MLLQPRRRVDGIAYDEALAGARQNVEAHERRSRVDADARLHVAVGRQTRERRQPVEQAQTRPHGAFGVVLVQLGHPEHAGHRVPDELLDAPAKGLDGAAGEPTVLLQEVVDVLRVELLGEAREADQVGEQHGDDAPLRGPRTAHTQRSPARQAEPRVSGALGRAHRAGDHAQ